MRTAILVTAIVIVALLTAVFALTVPTIPHASAADSYEKVIIAYAGLLIAAPAGITASVGTGTTTGEPDPTEGTGRGKAAPQSVRAEIEIEDLLGSVAVHYLGLETVAIAERGKMPALSKKRESLLGAWRSQVAAGMDPWTAFATVRDSECPGWTSPLFARSPAESVQARGRELFRQIVSALERHFYMDERWHYVVHALFILQSRVVELLPAVFYVFIGGRFGSGKTNLLVLTRNLTDGLLVENVSVPALARSLEKGKTVCLDEIDTTRGKELDEIRDALLRQGYKATAAPYIRWDAGSRKREEVPIYGPKVATLRGVPDDALASRGFFIPTVKPDGEEGFGYVLLNLWPELGDLNERLREWGDAAASAYSPLAVRGVAFSATFKEKVRKAAKELGANRESELVTVALLTAEIAGLDILEELSKATELRATELTEAEGDILEELRGVMLELTGGRIVRLDAAAPEISIKQSEVRREVNRRLKERGEPVLSDRRFAVLRRELGVKDVWLRKRGQALWWVFPATYLERLRGGTLHQDSLGSLGSPSTVSDEKGEPGEPKEPRSSGPLMEEALDFSARPEDRAPLGERERRNL